MANRQKCVNYYIRNSRHEMLFYINVVLFELLIEVFLEFVKAECISFFAGSIVVRFVLQTLIRQMYVIVLCLNVIIGRRCPQITMLKYVDFERVCD